VHEADDRAESARGLEQRLDPRDEIVRRADRRDARRETKAVFVDRLVGGLVRRARAPAAARCPVMYSLWWRSRPSRASARAFSRVSAMCQLISTRQFLRSTVWPCFGRASPRSPTACGSAFRPSRDSEPIEMMPMPCLPASVMPEGLICEATAKGMSSCSGSSCSAASCSVNQSDFR
jgi:hypothetical protein